MTRAVIIPAEGEPREVQFSTPPTLEEIKAVVGGWLEAVTTTVKDTMYLNVEGKILGLPFNRLATALAILSPDDYIAGDVVLLGRPDAEGYDTDAKVKFVEEAITE